MDPVFGIMLDVVRIATFQPHAANTETRRIEPDHALASTGTVTANDSPRRKAVRLPRWFKLSFMPR